MISHNAPFCDKCAYIQYIPRNMHTVFALLCFVVVTHWLIFPYPSGLLHWHCGNLTIAPVPAKQPWWIWINTSCEFIMNDCITTTKQSTTKPCAYFLGYTVHQLRIQGYCAVTLDKQIVVEQFHSHPMGRSCYKFHKTTSLHLRCSPNDFHVRIKDSCGATDIEAYMVNNFWHTTIFTTVS